MIALARMRIGPSPLGIVRGKARRLIVAATNPTVTQRGPRCVALLPPLISRIDQATTGHWGNPAVARARRSRNPACTVEAASGRGEVLPDRWNEYAYVSTPLVCTVGRGDERIARSVRPGRETEMNFATSVARDAWHHVAF
jgi:hypothetical protein